MRIFPPEGADAAGHGGERRLAFVALTRAEKDCTSPRQTDGISTAPPVSSRFLLDIDRIFLAFTRPPEEGLIRAARDYIGHSQTYLPETDGNMAFSVGQRVKHILFGSGTVLMWTWTRVLMVQFDEMETPRKISFRRSWNGFDKSWEDGRGSCCNADHWGPGEGACLQSKPGFSGRETAPAFKGMA